TDILTPPAEAVIMDPTDRNVLYACFREVEKSTDAGETWQTISGRIGCRSLTLNPQEPNTIYSSSFNFGVAKTTDGGKTWEERGQGLFPYIEVWSVAIDPLRSNILYAGTQGGIYKSENGATSWQPHNNGIVATSIATLAIDPKDTNTVYAGTSYAFLF